LALLQPSFTHTHVLNKDTYVGHFWCLISKYTQYDNIFINWKLKFCTKNFQPNAYEVKFSRNLLEKRAPRPLNRLSRNLKYITTSRTVGRFKCASAYIHVYNL